jgi:hypothetical protein
LSVVCVVYMWNGVVKSFSFASSTTWQEE